MNRTPVRYLRGESCPLLEAENRDVRQPGPGLAAVDAEPLEAPLEVVGEPPGSAVAVVAHEHPDALRLAVVNRAELERRGGRRRAAERLPDHGHLRRGSRAEERERD